MSKTTEKLQEAEFFLEQAEKNYLDASDFDYFLSAFITSARSVLWVMRHEYTAINGWEDWYQSLEPEPKEKELLKRINAARIRAEKRSPIKTRPRISLVVPKEHVTEKLKNKFENMTGEKYQVSFRQSDSQSPISQDIAEDGALSFLGNVEDVYRVLTELGENDVLDECKKYYLAIKEVVTTCENLFGKDKSN